MGNVRMQSVRSESADLHQLNITKMDSDGMSTF